MDEGMEGLEVFGKNWGVVLAQGILALIFGIMALVWPGLTIFALVVLFGAYALVDGVTSIVRAIRDRSTTPRWGLAVFGGLLGVAIGIITFVWPRVTARGLLLLIGIWSIIFGLVQIILFFEARKRYSGVWPLLISGILGVIFGIVVLAAPLAGALAIVWLIGLFAILEGLLLIWAAFVIRKESRNLSQVGGAATV